DSESNGQLISASVNARLLRNTSASLELASGWHGGQFEKGLQAQVTGSHSRITYDIDWIYSSPDFPGYYRDTNYLSAGLVLRPTSRLSLNLGYRNEKQNFEMDTTRYSAPLTRYFQAGLGLQFTLHTRVSLNYATRSSRDRMPAYLFDYLENTGSVRFDQSFKTLAFSVSAEAGKTENRRDGTVYDMNRTMASVRFAPSDFQSYNGYFYIDESNRYSSERMKLVTYGLEARYMLLKRAEFRLNYQNNSNPEDFYMDRNLFETLFRYTLPNSHVVQLRARLTVLRNSMDHRDKAFVVEYAAPIGIPLAVRKNSCIVKGLVLDAETGLPVRDLIIRINGSTAVTDKSGHFVFRNLSEKTYYLSFDKAAVGLNRVSVQKMPMEIAAVLGKEGRTVEFALTRGASLSGRVDVMKPKEARPSSGQVGQGPGETYLLGNGAEPHDTTGTKSGLANILVEISRDDEVQRRMTDSNGAYGFEELRPGSWTVKFYDYNLPEYHQFLRNSFEVELKPGDRIDLNASVLPKKRRIQLQQDGGVVREQPN
ncbi:MAG TPA: hypothetical protein VGB38_03295, partial [bacterium]